jgi:hypothetical protein
MIKAVKNRRLSEKKERLNVFLKQKGLKFTKQRDAIATEFLKSGEHMTAEELYRKINRKHPDSLRSQGLPLKGFLRTTLHVMNLLLLKTIMTI